MSPRGKESPAVRGNIPSSNRRSRKLSGQSLKNELFGLLIQEFQNDPDHLRSHFPEIAARLETATADRKHPPADAYFSTNLTERERDFRLNSLRSIVTRFNEGKDVSREDAIKALEDAASLKEQAEPFKDVVLDMARQVLDLSVTPEEATSVSFLKRKQVHHSYDLIRGMTLRLTWDGKLIKIEVDSKELELRRKALSIVGIGSDGRKDVATNHDSYLETIYDE